MPTSNYLLTILGWMLATGLTGAITWAVWVTLTLQKISVSVARLQEHVCPTAKSG